MSVAAPNEVPVTTTFAPGIGSPFVLLTTVPAIFPVVPDISGNTDTSTNNRIGMNTLFSCSISSFRLNKLRAPDGEVLFFQKKITKNLLVSYTPPDFSRLSIYEKMKTGKTP
jgi:hypothetical protein